MKPRLSASGYIIGGLLAMGLIVSARALIIPICVFGGIFLLYKFPPARWASLFASINGRKAGKKRKTAPFRVIQGNKTDDSEHRPKYH